MHKMRLTITLMGSMLGCAIYVGYEGDGSFIDRGIGGHERYIYDLGLVIKPFHEYKLGRMPTREECVMNFHVPTATGRMYEEHPDIFPDSNIINKAVDDARAEAARNGVVVEVVLKTQRGRIIFKQKAPLADWAWTQSYDWGNASCYRSMSEDGKTDPGTYFTPKRWESYLLDVRILAGEEFIRENRVRVIILGGGGWED